MFLTFHEIAASREITRLSRFKITALPVTGESFKNIFLIHDTTQVSFHTFPTRTFSRFPKTFQEIAVLRMALSKKRLCHRSLIMIFRKTLLFHFLTENHFPSGITHFRKYFTRNRTFSKITFLGTQSLFKLFKMKTLFYNNPKTVAGV